MIPKQMLLKNKHLVLSSTIIVLLNDLLKPSEKTLIKKEMISFFLSRLIGLMKGEITLMDVDGFDGDILVCIIKHIKKYANNDQVKMKKIISEFESLLSNKEKNIDKEFMGKMIFDLINQIDSFV